ncbi:MAG: TolC family protein [Nitrospira sp.]|nr:TolC family protein [Nitrospira sp.]
MRTGGCQEKKRPWRGATMLAMLFLLLVWSASLSSSALGQEPGSVRETTSQTVRPKMGLPDLIKLALKHNPGLSAIRKEVDVADQRILAAKGEHFGRINIEVSDFTYGPDNLPLTMKSLVVEQGRIVRDGAGEHNNNLFSFGGSITIPLYTGGRITTQIQLQELGKQLAGHQVAHTQDELIFNVTSVYYNILKIQDFIRATQKSKEQLGEAKRVVHQRFKVGKSAKVDTLKVNTRLAAVEQLLIRFLNAQKVLYGVLEILLGREAGPSQVTISGDLQTASHLPLEHSDLQAVQQQALQRRPELAAAKKEFEMQEKKIRISFAEHLPTVTVRGQVQGITGDNSALFAQEFAGIFLSVPLFAGGTIEAKVSQERIRYAKLRNELTQRTLKVTQEVQSAYLNTLEAQQRIVAAQAALDEAKEVLRIEAMKVQEGKSIIENLLDAQTAQLQAEQNYSAGVADYHIQLMALKKAIGMIEVEG